MRKLSTASLAILLMLSLLAIGPLSVSVQASSHREAPSTAVDPMVDATDVYAFVDPVDPTRVTLIMNFIPFQIPQGGPNFYQFGDSALYEMRIDNNGDAVTDISIRFDFRTEVRNTETFLYNTGVVTSLTDADLNIRQFYDVIVVRNPGLANETSSTIATNVPVAPSNVGVRSMPNYETDLAIPAIRSFNSAVGMNDITVFAGQRDEGFFVDVGSIFDLVGLRPFNSAHLIPRMDTPGVDGTAGFNVSTIAMQVPIRELTFDRQPLTGNPDDPRGVISVYSAVTRPGVITYATDRSGGVVFSGPQVQLSRLGNPLVNELFVALRFKDRFNASLPSMDAQFLPFFLNPEPARLLGAGGPPPSPPSPPGSPSTPDVYPTINVPPAPRNDIATVYLTGIPGLNQQQDLVGSGVAAFTGQPADTVPQERMRLNMGIPPTAGTASAAGTANRLGFLGGDRAGYPNGRRVGDDAVDITIRVAAGATPFTPAFNIAPNNILGDGVNENDRPFLTRFPYLATPYSGYDSPTTPPQGIGTTNTQAPASPRPEPTPRP
ncbi:MAG: DUF4331 domain-containing protein [Pyrinomonadaceae bacterium]